VRDLNLLVLRSANMLRARAFYELLGLHFTTHAHGSGPEHYAHEDECGVFEIYPANTSTSVEMTGLGFEVSNLETVHASMNEFQPKPIRDEAWGRTFVVRDPDGRRVEIKQRR
jgi:catechol 2,3-dioxygenase-like lactoylglutathione lyase family enzyme